MGKKLKLAGKKMLSQRSMRDKYWKQVLTFAEQKSWAELDAYVDKYPWLATAAMGPTILPDYLAGDKSYGLLRLLCNVEDVPVEIIRKIIARGAKDAEGRGYLERLLVGDSGDGATDPKLAAAADSPVIAAEVLRTCTRPSEVIEKMQQVLEQGIQDDDAGRKLLAERCVGRSQLFYDLLMLLYENDAQNRLDECLANIEMLVQPGNGGLADYAEIEKILAGH
jgi:hypothetical protein